MKEKTNFISLDDTIDDLHQIYIDIHYFTETETYLYKSNIIEESIFFIKKLYYLYEPTKIMISFDLDLDLDIEKKDNLKKFNKDISALLFLPESEFMKKWEKTLSSTTTIPKIEFLDENIQGTSTNRIIQDLHNKKKRNKNKNISHFSSS